MTHEGEIILVGAVIYYGKNTSVPELPVRITDPQMKLKLVGASRPMAAFPARMK